MGKIIIVTALLIRTSSLFAADQVGRGGLEQEWVGNGYSLKIFRDMEAGTGEIEIYKGDKEVYREDGFKFNLGLVNDDIPEGALVKPGKDITGDGVPDLVISHWSGGAHCCFDYYVFSLGDQFSQIAKIENRDSDLGKFIDVDGDGVLEFIGSDWTFAYWHVSFAGSPAPDVIYQFKDGQYRIALEKMRRSLDADKHKALLKEIKHDIENISKDKEDLRKMKEDDVLGWSDGNVGVPPEVWGYMLDLIYSGNASEALSLIDEVWPPGAAGKDDFLKDFLAQLAESPHWNEIAKTMPKSK
jgi:hypothetical protein